MTRWTILPLAWLALLLSFVDRLAWSSVAVEVSGSSGLPLTSLGIFASSFFTGYVLSNLFGGILVDRIGSRFALGYALSLLGITTFAFGFTNGIAVGIAVQFLMGFAAGADYSACIKLMTTWFEPRRRGQAIGLLMTSLPIGVIVANAVVPWALKHMPWPTVYHVLGALSLLLGGVLLALLRDAPRAGRQPPITASAILAVVRNAELSRLALVGFGAAWGTWGFVFWATALMVKGRELSPAQAAMITVVYGAAAIVAKPVTGWLSDRIGGRRKAPIVIVLALYAAGLLLFGSLTTPLQFGIAAVLLGFFGFSWGPLLATLVAEVGGVAVAGTATGVTNALQQMGGVVVPIAVGFAFQHSHSFFGALAMMAIGPLIAMAVMALFCRDANYSDGKTRGFAS